jgi:hypothetical protein
MITSRRVAFLLAVAAHILLLYALSTFGHHPFRYTDFAKSFSVTIILPHPMPVGAASRSRQDVVPPNAAKPMAKALVAAPAKAPSQLPPPATVKTEEMAATSSIDANSISLTQSALNAVGKMDQEERRSTRSGANVMSNSLAARLSSSIDKYAPAKAGTIDENIYPDGRREERIHLPFGGVVCITYESPSNPVDGFDTMQRGLKPSVPHSCGHRFD